MDYEFRWSPDIAADRKAPAEEAIRDGQESGDSPISFCHAGTVVVTLSTSDALQKRFVGEMKCSCGKVRGTLKGKCNGATVMFEAVGSDAAAT